MYIQKMRDMGGIHHELQLLWYANPGGGDKLPLVWRGCAPVLLVFWDSVE